MTFLFNIFCTATLNMLLLQYLLKMILLQKYFVIYFRRTATLNLFQSQCFPTYFFLLKLCCGNLNLNFQPAHQEINRSYPLVRQGYALSVILWLYFRFWGIEERAKQTLSNFYKNKKQLLRVIVKHIFMQKKGRKSQIIV